MDLSNDFERVVIFQQTRTAAEAAYAKNPFDADNLTRWGASLLELSSHEHPSNSENMLRAAISKFEEALGIDSTKADALWLLGNSLMALAFTNPDTEVAKRYFSEAAEHLAMACEVEPDNVLYRKSLDIVAKGPELHAQFKKQHAADQQAAGATNRQTSSSSTRTATKKGKNSDLKYDIMGWVFLGVAALAWVGFSHNHMTHSHPPPR